MNFNSIIVGMSPNSLLTSVAQDSLLATIRASALPDSQADMPEKQWCCANVQRFLLVLAIAYRLANS
jgi:hypothetical protein